MFEHEYADALPDLVSQVSPTPLQKARLVVKNAELAAVLGLSDWLTDDDKFLEDVFAPEGEIATHSVAQKYGGHQFGHWNPELGDGRGLLLGSVQDKTGQSQDLHLKGSGQTPYSRFGDGRAVLRSTIREYLGSEALHHLGIPSSRALCLIDSQEPVEREKTETGAMLIRTCPSHIRFGHFEYYHYQGDNKQLDRLTRFTLHNYYPEIADAPDAVAQMLKQITIDTATMVAKWQAYGFNHGVMNTDNMSIHGITFDFGPFAFLDDFVPNFICNHSDHTGRYAFDQQPTVALWNLNALAHGLSRYVSSDDIKEQLELFEPTLVKAYYSELHKRLGLCEHSEQTVELTNAWLTLLAREKADFHTSFRLLCDVSLDDLAPQMRDHFVDRQRFDSWFAAYREIVSGSDWDEQQLKMRKVNPKFVARNALLQRVIASAEKGDFSLFQQVEHVLRAPFEEHPTLAHLSLPPNDNEKGVALSCSS